MAAGSFFSRARLQLRKRGTWSVFWLTVNVVVTGPVVVTQFAVQAGVGDGIKNVLARAGVGAGDQEDGSCIVDEADAGGEFGVAGAVEDVGSGEARREGGVADDLVPVEANAGGDQQAIGDEPAIFGIGADFGVELLVKRRGS